MSLQRSSFLQKLLCTSFNLLKKNSVVFTSKVFSKSFKTKQIKSCLYLRNFSRKNIYDEVYFWKNYRLLLATLTQINFIAVISREFSKSFEAIIKNCLILQKCLRWSHFRKNCRRLLCIFFKDTINPSKLFIFTNVICSSRLALWVGYFLYFKFTRVSSIVYQSLHL